MAGSLVQTYAFDSFGKQTASSGSITNPFQYTGRESDTETGLYYYRARYYDTNTGRFLSEDPVSFSGGIDFYTYVENNPVELTDLFGLQAKPKPLPVPTPPDPAPGRPVLVPDPVAPSVGQEIIGWVGDVAGAVGIILTMPQDLNRGEPDPGADPNSSPDRRINPPNCPKKGCRCTCRADADDTMAGNIRPGLPLFRFATWTASNCEEAVKEAKRLAIHRLGMKPKHVPCKCTGN